ncbi:MAG: rhomboid family intramembrane serine protease [Flavobacteriales bacterium]|nr:rhomboid family intramembrane serine protease [Flavobacteriales bacterium]
MNQYRAGGFRLLPDVVKNLIIINVIMHLAYYVLLSRGINLNDMLGLHYFNSEKFKIYQVFTYMFMHGDWGHLFFNMFAVWMFGSAVENLWGPRRFLIYYFITGIGAAALHYTIVHLQIAPDIMLFERYFASPDVQWIQEIAQNHRFIISPDYQPELYMRFEEFEDTIKFLSSGHSTDNEHLNLCSTFLAEYFEHFKNLPNVVGASGSLFGLLLAFGMLFPNQRIYLLFFPVGIKAKYFVAIYGVIELYSGLKDTPGDNVAHFAHLGGMLFGFILIKIWQKNRFRYE